MQQQACDRGREGPARFPAGQRLSIGPQQLEPADKGLCAVVTQLPIVVDNCDRRLVTARLVNNGDVGNSRSQLAYPQFLTAGIDQV